MNNARLSLSWLAGSLFASVMALALLLVVANVSSTFGDLIGVSSINRAYHDFVRKPLMKFLFGVDVDLPWVSILLDMGLIWLSLFAIINFIVYKHEGVGLWSHIRKNYCSRQVERWTQTCTLAKWLFALLATPYACARIALAGARSERTIFTSCYITLNPNDVALLLRKFGYAVMGLTLALALLRRLLAH